MVITNKQIKAFEAVEFPSFEDKMVLYMEEYHETFTASLKKDEISAFIQFGYEKAKKYNLFTAYEVGLFIDILLLLGSGFDKDPQYSWANNMLFDVNVKDPTQKIEALYDDVTEYIEILLDKDKKLPTTAFQKLANLSLTSFASINETNLADVLLEHFHELWKRKFYNTEEIDLRKLIRYGVKKAKNYGYISLTTQTYFSILMYFFGHDFDVDPKYQAFAIIQNEGKVQELEQLKILQKSVNDYILSTSIFSTN